MVLKTDYYVYVVKIVKSINNRYDYVLIQNAVQRCYGVYHLGDTQKPSEHGPG